MKRLLLAACVALTPLASRADDLRADDLVAKGEYLTRAADCAACHTAPGGQPYAGGRAFKLPFGTIYSPNITPDATGIAGYSDADWLSALHQGIGRGGKHLYPAMPYASYTQMTDDDALAIKAYLMTLPPVRATPPANTLKFPFDQRWGLALWNIVNNPDHRFAPDAAKPGAYNRGAYLVTALGHCAECHTPRTATLGLDRGQNLAGAVAAGWRAPNITADPAHGIGGWTDAALAEYLTTGFAPGHGPASGGMAEAITNSLRFLTPDDIAAIVTYLRGVSANSAGALPPQPGSAAPIDSLGAHLFQQACAGCHLPSGQGRQSQWAALEGAASTADPAATNLIAILTQGSEVQTPQGLMFMHAFSGGYSDTELAAIANYTTAQFGHIQTTITPDQIKQARAQLP